MFIVVSTDTENKPAYEPATVHQSIRLNSVPRVQGPGATFVEDDTSIFELQTVGECSNWK